MKKSGCYCDFNEERASAIMRAYRREIASSRFIRFDDIVGRVMSYPPSRFYVSEERALAVVSALIRGRDVLAGMHPSKSRMFSEIFRRVSLLRKSRSDCSLASLVAEVIYSPAPEFYLSHRYIKDLIIENRRKCLK